MAWAEPSSDPIEVTPESIAECKDAPCLFRAMPRNKPLRIAPGLCDSVAGSASGDEGDGPDLGVLCEMVVARNLASTRSVHPCARNGGPDPDWEPDLKQDWLMWAESRLGYATIDAGQPPLPGTRASKRGSRHRTYFRDMRFRTTEGRSRVGYRYVMTYCIAEAPEPTYVPYFHWLMRDDEVLHAGPADSPLASEPVLAQARNLVGGGRAFLITQLDGKGEDDLLAVTRMKSLGSVRVVACVHDPEATTCEPRMSDPIKPSVIGVVPELTVHNGRVTLEFVLHDHVHATAVLALGKDGIEIVSRTGEFVDP